MDIETVALSTEDMERLRRALLYYASTTRLSDTKEYALLRDLLPTVPCYLIKQEDV
jgi:hypothetical protein